LTPQIDVDAILVAVTEKYKNEDSTTIDGVKLILLKIGYTLENRTQNLLSGFILKFLLTKKQIVWHCGLLTRSKQLLEFNRLKNLYRPFQNIILKGFF
jgi:hypothetical protein